MAIATEAGTQITIWKCLDISIDRGEITTYEQWLRQPETMLQVINSYFDVVLQRVSFGKIGVRAQPRF
jgi:hypothetical protein